MILIINSPLFREKNDRYDEDSLPPIGLGYIAMHLKQAGFDVELIDAVHERIPLTDLLEIVNQKKPSFIASNIFTTNCELVKEFVESIRFKTHLIIGGLSTKDLHKEVVNWKTDNHIDVVVGDGELICIDIVKDSLKETPVIHRKNRRIFNVFSNSRYFVNDINKSVLDRSFFKNEPTIHPFGFFEANLIASRGCIFNCTFCAAARSLNKEYGIRERSAGSLQSELREILSLYPYVNSIRVLDDLFLKSSRHVDFAINVFSDFDLKWRSMAHVTTFNNVDHTKLTELKKSGCDELFFGIESGSPKILKSINKTSHLKTIVKNLSAVLRAGINIKGYFIYGFPEETHDDMEMTYQLAKQLKKISLKHGSQFRTSVFQYRPYHGTAIFHDLYSIGIKTTATSIQPDEELNDIIGRLQFNFHDGNYSRVDTTVVHDYIYRTTKLTDLAIYSRIKSTTRTRKA
jgi:radical SAM superfamily enzyme YgiQ (UPF0313 family)